jgi:hypothetical protein
MDARGINLDNAQWMCDPAASRGFADYGNARHVFDRLSNGSMPPDGPWPPAWINIYQTWMSDGFAP